MLLKDLPHFHKYNPMEVFYKTGYRQICYAIKLGKDSIPEKDLNFDYLEVAYCLDPQGQPVETRDIPLDNIEKIVLKS